MIKSKDKVFDALDILNTINMEYEKFSSDCKQCKILGLGKVNNACNIQGYCPAFLSDREVNTLTKVLL